MIDRIEKYCDVISGYAFKSTDLKDCEEIPVIKIGNISNGQGINKKDSQYVSRDFLSIDKKYHVCQGDILISLTGSHMNQPNSVVGRTCRNFEDKLFLLNQRAGKIICKDESDKNYMYYLFNTKAIKECVVNRAYGAANQVNVSPSDIKRIKWDFHSKNERQTIGTILSKYDNLIEANNKRIKILEQMAEELYKEWFVRFRFPGHENAEFKNGKPISWKQERLEEFGITLDSGSRPSGGIDNSIKEGVPSIGAESVRALGEFDYEGVKLIPEDYYSKLRRGKNTGEDILVYKDGAYIGKVTIFMNGFPYKRFAVNEHVFLLNANNKLFQYYLYFTLHMPEYFALMQNLNRNAAQPGLSKPDMKRIKILVPDSSLVHSFNVVIKPILDEIFKLSSEKKILQKQRDLLLPRLMSGKLEV